MSVEMTRAAVDWALSSRTCSAAALPVSDAVAANVIATATADGVVDAGERDELSRFATRALLSQGSQSQMIAAFALPKQSADSLRRSRQAATAADLARQGVATGSNEGAALGVGMGAILLLDALFGNR